MPTLGLLLAAAISVACTSQPPKFVGVTPVTDTPPQILSNLQEQITNWCSGKCATGHTPDPSPAPTASITRHVSQPSRSGNSTELQIVPAPNATGGDVLYYTPSLGSAGNATNFVFSFWFMIDQPVWDSAKNVPLALHALEFDFNDFMPGYDYNFSSQCRLVQGQGNSVWQIWGQSASGGTTWIDSGVTCHPETFTPNAWHQIVWTYRIYPQSNQTQYVSLEIDGVMQPGLTPVLNPVQTRTSTHNALEVQFQQDPIALPSPKPFTEWVDDVTLTYW